MIRYDLLKRKQVRSMENFIGNSFKQDQYLNKKHQQEPKLNNDFQLNNPSFNNPFAHRGMSLSAYPSMNIRII